MAAIPGKKSATPFTPTVDAIGDPTCCLVCGMRAVALGVTYQRMPKDDPGYICKRCAISIDDYSKIRRLDEFELAALDAGVAAVGEWIAENGFITELAHYDELQQRLLVKAAWEGCARGVREALKEAPF